MSRGLAAAALGVASLAALALAASVPARADMPREGDRGVVRTTLRGQVPEDIPVRFVGTFENFAGPGYDLYLVELEGPVGEHVGVASGMSGSPVYFDGELLGALSYSMGFFPKDAIGGVTPIADMLAARRIDDAGRVAIGGAPGVASPVAASPGAARLPAGGADGWRPIAVALHAAGLHPEVRDWLEPRFAELGVRLASGAISGGASGARGSAALVPGAPVGVGLMRGDLSIAASGTVTHVEGERVYAFGHPFLGQGRIELPMLEAHVLHTLADQAGSLKMTEVGREIGAFSEDRLSAVVGALGRRAALAPMTLRAVGGAYGDTTFRFELAGDSTFTGLLAAAGVANSLTAHLGYDRRQTMIASGTVRFAGLPPLPFETAIAGGPGGAPAAGVAAALMQRIQAVRANPFRPVVLESVDVTVRVQTEERLYRLRSLLYDRGTLRPGGTLAVRAVLEPYRGEPVERTFEVPVPADLRGDDRLILAVGPPDRVQVALGRPLDRRARSARDLATWIEIETERRSPHRLQAALVRRAEGVVRDGSALEALPPTARKLLSADASTGRASRAATAPLWVGAVELDGPVTGGQMIRLRVDGDLEREAGSDEPDTAPTDPGGDEG